MKKSKLNTYNPTGTIIAITGTVPDGYLACDGSYVNIADYQNLYNVLTNEGTTFPYGANSGSTFKLPDLSDSSIEGGTQSNIGTSTGNNVNVESPLGIEVSGGNFTSNYTTGPLNYSVDVTNLNLSTSDSNTNSHQVSANNFPAHSHETINWHNRALTGNTEIQHSLVNLNNVTPRNTVNRNLYLIGNATNHYANGNYRYRRRAGGQGNAIRYQTTGNQEFRYRGQGASDASRIDINGGSGNNQRVDVERYAADLDNTGTNVMMWGETWRGMDKGHSHGVGNLYSGSQINAGNVTTSNNDAGEVNIDMNNEGNFNVGADINCTFSDLQGKQVLVLYAIKY